MLSFRLRMFNHSKRNMIWCLETWLTLNDTLSIQCCERLSLLSWGTSVILTTYCLGGILVDYNNSHTENLKGIRTSRGDRNKRGKKSREMVRFFVSVSYALKKKPGVFEGANSGIYESFKKFHLDCAGHHKAANSPPVNLFHQVKLQFTSELLLLLA